MLLKLILTELRFTIRSFNQLTVLYKNLLDRMDPEKDLKNFFKFFGFIRKTKHSKNRKKETEFDDEDEDDDSDDNNDEEEDVSSINPEDDDDDEDRSSTNQDDKENDDDDDNNDDDDQEKRETSKRRSSKKAIDQDKILKSSIKSTYKNRSQTQEKSIKSNQSSDDESVEQRSRMQSIRSKLKRFNSTPEINSTERETDSNQMIATGENRNNQKNFIDDRKKLQLFSRPSSGQQNSVRNRQSALKIPIKNPSKNAVPLESKQSLSSNSSDTNNVEDENDDDEDDEDVEIKQEKKFAVPIELESEESSDEEEIEQEPEKMIDKVTIDSILKMQTKMDSAQRLPVPAIRSIYRSKK